MGIISISILKTQKRVNTLVLIMTTFMPMIATKKEIVETAGTFGTTETIRIISAAWTSKNGGSDENSRTNLA